MQTIALVAKPGKQEALELAEKIRLAFPSLNVFAETELAKNLNWPIPTSDAWIDQAELLVVLGGDGTLIHAARLLRGRPTPLLGVNLGTLGFMTEISQSQVLDFLAAVVAGHFFDRLADEIAMSFVAKQPGYSRRRSVE